MISNKIKYYKNIRHTGRKLAQPFINIALWSTKYDAEAF